MITEVREQVAALLKHDNSGHGMDHIDRVVKLSLRFAVQEKADQNIVSLIALLHDIDDYKLFGEDHSKKLINARALMLNC